jgi:hypothetical protein
MALNECPSYYKVLDILLSNGYLRHLHVHEGSQPHHRVNTLRLSVGLIALAIFTIINVFNLVTIKIFLIPSPIFIGYSINK